MSWDENLTGATYNIAKTERSPLRVKAGPGTGKTFALKRRIARLLENKTEPSRILAVTFTRVAAFDLIRELRNLNIDGCDKINAGTLHSFCFSILHSQNVFRFLERVPRPLNYYIKSKVLKFEGEPLLFDIRFKNDFGSRRECTRKILAFEAAWARLQSETPGWPQEISDRIFHDTLLNWLIFHKSILIGELIPLSLKFLRSNPSASVLSDFDHIIVDEYQDLNKAEQTLIDLLVGDKSFISIVGDSDQSIYRFRYAHPDGINDYNITHPDTHDEELIDCIRCPKRVVSIADYFIKYNDTNYTDSHIKPVDSNPDGEIYIVQWDDLEQEATQLALYIKFLVEVRGYEPGDILVLSPRSIIGCGIRDKLLELIIPTHSYYNEELLHNLDVQKSLTLLSLLVNNEDRVSLRWWLGHESQTWLQNQYSVLRSYCEENNTSPWVTLKQIKNGNLTITRINQICENFDLLNINLESLGNNKGIDLIDKLFPSSNDNFDDIRKLTLSFTSELMSPKDIYEKLLLNINQPEIPIEGEYVRVMSLHKSKGLTSKVVIVAGCIHGLIPFIDKNQSYSEIREIMKEQRRLFYVTITRCKDILVLSSAIMLKRDLAHRMGAYIRGGDGIYGKTISSNFISELGPDSPQPQRGITWKENNYSN